jgi:hypothetical protein
LLQLCNSALPHPPPAPPYLLPPTAT